MAFFYRESRYGARSGGEEKNPAGCESAAGFSRRKTDQA
jgi:hypothetical protein